MIAGAPQGKCGLPAQGYKKYVGLKANDLALRCFVVLKGSSDPGRKTLYNIKQHEKLELAGAGSAGRGR
jgi:hypothetical protein